MFVATLYRQMFVIERDRLQQDAKTIRKKLDRFMFRTKFEVPLQNVLAFFTNFGFSTVYNVDTIRRANNFYIFQTSMSTKREREIKSKK